MHNGKPLASLALGLGLMTALLSTGVAADSFSGKTNLTCAAVHVMGCTEDGNCIDGSSRSFDLPTFLFIDLKKKLVRTTKDSGKDASSPIENMEITDNAVILQGFENDRGWTAAIDRSNGHLTLSAVGAEVAFLILGNCTAK